MRWKRINYFVTLIKPKHWEHHLDSTLGYFVPNFDFWIVFCSIVVTATTSDRQPVMKWLIGVSTLCTKIKSSLSDVFCPLFNHRLSVWWSIACQSTAYCTHCTNINQKTSTYRRKHANIDDCEMAHNFM